MTQEQLAHILRAAAEIAGDDHVVLIGSQAILGTYSESRLPESAIQSIEADIAFRSDPDGKKAACVEGAIGELSNFHETYGYYGQGVQITTAVLPRGWQERLIRFVRADADPCKAECLDAHDLVISKLVAGREKDIDFCQALITANIISPNTLRQRAGQLDVPGAVIKRVSALIDRCA